ncbi:MAG: hypothetical protein C0597_08050, partial [Marinilabiliales bacterium]
LPQITAAKKMKLKKYILLFIFILANSVILFSSEKRNVLILNSYHKGLKWTDDIVSGINKGLSENFLDLEIYTEFLDSKRFFHYEDYYSSLFSTYKTKYSNIDFDVIIVSDDFALNFMLDCRDTIFGEIPVVFCGINNPHNYPESYTGVLESIEFIKNFELIKQIHPDYSKIYFIVDETKTGDIIYDRAYKALLTANDEFRYEFLRDYSFDELYKKVTEIDDAAILFLTAFTKDRLDVYCSYNKIVSDLKRYANVPIYGAWDFYLDKGICGGRLITGYNQGYEAALIANRILNGTNISDISIEVSSSELVFDHNELKHHNIKRRDLPELARIINNPMAFITQNKQQTIFFSIILILLLVVILILWTYMILRKRKIKEERRYHKTIELNNEKLHFAKEKAEESDRLKSAFLANISHELRTPMNGIIGFSKLILDSDDLSQETIIKYLNIINKSGYLLLDLLNDIIDLSKIEAKQLKLNNSEFRLNELIEELLSFFISERNNQGKQNIKILAEKEYDYKDLSIFSDSNRIRQILYNLLSNALKFTNEGSIKFGYYIEVPNIVFFVKDTGVGLNELEKELIFERFRQVDDKSTRRYGGAGIGLSICKGIVENLNGKIWVDSQKGEGSTFYFTIPFSPGKSEVNKKNEIMSHQEYCWPNKSILIVEDSKVSYDLLTKFLKDSKVEFFHASDGEQAVELCKLNHKIDLVLMDIKLPIMDGLEATEQIKKIKPELPIIAQTANAMDDDEAVILAAGCDDYISKPISRLDLLQKIDKYLNQKQ